MVLNTHPTLAVFAFSFLFIFVRLFVFLRCIHSNNTPYKLPNISMSVAFSPEMRLISLYYFLFFPPSFVYFPFRQKNNRCFLDDDDDDDSEIGPNEILFNTLKLLAQTKDVYCTYTNNFSSHTRIMCIHSSSVCASVRFRIINFI